MKDKVVRLHSVEEEIKILKNSLVRLNALVNAMFPLNEEWCGAILKQLREVGVKVYKLEEWKGKDDGGSSKVDRPW